MSMHTHMDTHTCCSYQQMCGRAGRTGQGKYGESFMVVKSKEEEKLARDIMTRSTHLLSDTSIERHRAEHLSQQFLLVCMHTLCTHYAFTLKEIIVCHGRIGETEIFDLLGHSFLGNVDASQTHVLLMSLQANGQVSKLPVFFLHCPFFSFIAPFFPSLPPRNLDFS